jgi:hypothetical protein
MSGIGVGISAAATTTTRTAIVCVIIEWRTRRGSRLCSCFRNVPVKLLSTTAANGVRHKCDENRNNNETNDAEDTGNSPSVFEEPITMAVM